MKNESLIVLKSTGAIGDLVIASALIPELGKKGYKTGIISKGFTLPLWNGLEGALTFENEENLPENAKVFDISDYLGGLPYSNSLPSEFAQEERSYLSKWIIEDLKNQGYTEEFTQEKRSHLCKWMAYSFYQKSKIPIFPSRDNVMIKLTPEEIARGERKIREVSGEHNNFPVLLMAPYATTKNRNLPKKTLEEVARGVSSFAVPCLFEPFKDEQYIEGTYPIGDMDLRKASAILFATDAYLGVDSGPLHMINAVLQGFEGQITDINVDKSKIIVTIGSSYSDSVAYEGNQIIFSNGGCDIAPCGAHGYFECGGYIREFGRKFYKIDKDKSVCIFSDYNQTETAKCMESISADEIIEKVRTILS